MSDVRKAVFGLAALAVMPGCGCGKHSPAVYNFWDWLNAYPLGYFSRGRWWTRRLALSGWLIDRARPR